MTSRERVLCALDRGTPDRVPYCEVGIDEPVVYRLLGETPLKDHPFDTAEDTLHHVVLEKEISRILGRDNICYNLRPPILAHRNLGGDNILFYGDGMIRSEEDLEKLQLPDPYDDRMYAPAKEFLRQSEGFATVAACRLGISPAYLSMDIESFAIALYDNPGLVDEVLRRYTEWSAAVVERVCDLGFDLIWTADDIAFKTGTYLSPQMFRERILPHVRKVAEKIRIPWIFHSDGDLMGVLDDLIPLGMKGLHPIEPEAMDIAQVKRHYGDRLCLVGNISVNSLSVKTPDEVRAEVRQRLRKIAPGGGYILSSGNSLTSYCKMENILAMTETVREYGNYPIA